MDWTEVIVRSILNILWCLIGAALIMVIWKVNDIPVLESFSYLQNVGVMIAGGIITQRIDD